MTELFWLIELEVMFQLWCAEIGFTHPLAQALMNRRSYVKMCMRLGDHCAHAIHDAGAIPREIIIH